MKEKDEDFFRFSSSIFDSFSCGTCYSKYIEKRNTQTIGGMKHEKNVHKTTREIQNLRKTAAQAQQLPHQVKQPRHKQQTALQAVQRSPMAAYLR